MSYYTSWGVAVLFALLCREYLSLSVVLDIFALGGVYCTVLSEGKECVLWGKGEIKKVLICDGNKVQFHSKQVKIYEQNSFFLNWEYDDRIWI